MSDTLKLLVDGEEFNIWQSFRWGDSFLEPLGSYSLTAAPPLDQVSTYNKLLKKGELVEVYINDSLQASPLITSVSKAIDQNGVTFSVNLKSQLATPTEGSVDPTISKRFVSDAPIAEVVKEVMSNYGFGDVKVDDADNFKVMSGKNQEGRKPSGLLLKNLKAKDIEAKPNEKAYGFASRLFTRLGLILRVDANGDLLLVAPDYKQPIAYTLIQGKDTGVSGDTMLNGISVTESNDMSFSEAVIRGSATYTKKKKRTNQPVQRVVFEGAKQKDGTPFKTAPTTEITSTRASYSADTKHSYKPRIILDKESRDSKRALSTAKLVMGARSYRGYQVKCSVNGFVGSTGRIWTINSIARVVIQALDVDEEMFIFARSLNQDQSGQKTSLTLIPKYSLVLGDVPG